MDAGLWRLSRKTWQWPVIVGLALVAFALGIVGFAQYSGFADEPRGALDWIYMSLQLFSLGFDAWEKPVPRTLEAARFLAVFVAAWALLKTLAFLFYEQLHSIRLRFCRNHVVVCGMSRKTFHIVRGFRAAGATVVVVEKDREAAYLTACRDVGAFALVGDATVPGTLRRAGVARAEEVVVACGADEVNVQIASYACEACEGASLSARDTAFCLVHLADPVFASLLSPHGARVRCFNVEENSVRLMFRDFPPDRAPLADSTRVHLVVCGATPTAGHVVVEAAKQCHYANGMKAAVTVVAPQAQTLRRQLFSRYPALGGILSLTFIDDDLTQPEIMHRLKTDVLQPDDLLSLIVAHGEDADNVGRAIRCAERLADIAPRVLCLVAEDAGLRALLRQRAAVIKQVQIEAFGDLGDACSRDTLLEEALDAMAKVIHEDYANRRRQEGRDPSDPSVLPWHRLTAGLRESCRQQAEHIPVKLRAVGCRIGTSGENGERVTAFDEKTEVPAMARMEHARWNANLLLDGWKFGAIKNDEAKTHPCIVDWEQLPRDVQEWDREPVRNIPALVRQAGKCIYRGTAE